MTTEEILKEMGPLALELDYAEELEARADAATGRRAGEAASADADEFTLTETEEAAEHRTKKGQILSLYESGTRDIAEIVRQVKARPSYVAQVLQSAGHLDGYFDLYTTTGREQNVYTRYFRNVLAFRNAEAARESVARIERLYNYFERLGDRAGQHQAMVLARDGAELHVSSFSGDGVAGGVVFLTVEDVDALHAELVAGGVSVALAPTDQTWGNREMYVKDEDGNSVRFVQAREAADERP